MLVLTRCVGEKLIIGDDIEIVIKGIHGGQVKVGISAPADVIILRSELASGQKGNAEALSDSALTRE